MNRRNLRGSETNCGTSWEKVYMDKYIKYKRNTSSGEEYTKR